MMALSCNQDWFLAWMLLLMSFSEVQSDCTSPVPPLHSTLKEDIPKEGYPVETVLTYHCITGYEYIPGIKPSITCLNTSKWSEISSLCRGKECPAPKIENSNTGTHDDNDIRLGGNITISCKHGFRLVGEAALKCVLREGKVVWNREFPICEHIPCKRPDNIPNGQFDRDPKDEYYVGSVVIYRCKSDFSLIGNSTIMCITTEDGLNGKWNLPAPECKVVKCDRPKVENGKLVNFPKPSYTYNDGIYFECNSGYSAVGNLHINCGANSLWIPAIPKCVKDNCTSPVPPLHSTLKEDIPKEGYPVGTVLTYHCITGYEYIPGIKPSSTCLNTSKWSEISSLCRGRKCPPPIIVNGKILSANDFRLGAEVTLACEYGFRIIGGSVRRCVLKPGKVDWNKELPFCERIPCARPPLIANGRYDPNPSDVYDVGSIIIYRCDTDYSLIGQSTIICIRAENGIDGKWTWPSPECKQVKCYRPSIPNGKVASVFQATYTYQNKIVIECNPGYTLVGSSLVECDADSQWKPSAPWCDKRECPTPVLPPYSSVRDGGDLTDTYAVGTVLRLQCVPGYENIPEIIPRMTCLDTSNWSALPTLCQEVKCYRPSIPNGKVASVLQTTYTYQNKIVIECNPGYTLVGSSLVECDADSQWKPSVPRCDKYKSLEDRLDIIEKKLDLILRILQPTRHRKTICF